MALELDLTGAAIANKVTNEAHNTSLEINRFIVPKEGGFYSRNLVVRNAATGAALRPILDYALYEPVEEIWTSTAGLGAYKIIHIYNQLVVAVRIDYQAIGGEFSYTVESLEAEIGNLLAGGSKSLPFGHVSGMPLGGLPPELHFEDARETYDAGKVVLAVNHLVDAINTGDRLGLSQVYQYIANAADEYHNTAMSMINSMNTRLDNLTDILDQGIGDIIISDNPTPPHVRLGYGQFQLSPDILLIGNNASSNVGDLVGLAAGSDYFARRTNIWRQVEDLGQVTYSLAKSATAINEGQSVTFTLSTTGLTPGTNVPYRITGSAGFTAADIVGTPLNGFFTIGADGTGQVIVRATEDNASEGSETFTLSVTAAANVAETVTINDTSRSPSINIRFSGAANGSGTITQIDEGQTAYLVIDATNIPNGHVLNLTYGASSAQNDDFDSERPSTVTVNGTTTIIPYAIRADRRDDGNRTLVPSISSSIVTTPVSTTLTIRDTSRAPTYQMWFSREATGNTVATSIDEGQRVYLHIQTTEVDIGTVFNLQYAGQATDDDFNEARPATATIGTGGKVVIEYYTKNDFTSEGDESFAVNLVKDGAILRSTNILILDTSANPNYVLGFYADANGTTSREVANEGDTVYLVLKTQNVPSGTQYSIVTNPANTTASAADFTTAIPTKLTVGSDGKGAAALSIRNDFLSEGVEMLQLIAKDGAGEQIGTATLVINDTSVNSTAVGQWSMSTANTPIVTQANEGQTVYLHFTGTNMPANARIDLSYPTGAGMVDNNDFTATRATSLTLNSSGRGYVSYTLKNDTVREGDETFQVKASYGDTDLGLFSILIKDTSIPVLDARITGAADGTGTLSSVNEGSRFYLYLFGQGFPIGQRLNITYGGLSASDFDIVPVPSTQLDAQLSSAVAIQVSANMRTDGNRTLTLHVSDQDNVLLRTLNIAVNDTSKSPTYSMVWSTSPSGVPAITNAAMGDNTPVYLVVNTTNVPDGTQLTLHRKGTEYNASDFATPVKDIETITINNNRAALTVSTVSRNSNVAVGFVGELNLPITQANEGDEVYLAITTSWSGPGEESQWNENGGTRFYLRLRTGTGYANADDLTTILPAYLTWGGGSGQASPQVDKLKIRLKLDDVIEGTEKLAIEVNRYSDFRDSGSCGTAMLDLLDLTNDEEVITINSWNPLEAMNLMKVYKANKGGLPTKAVNVRFIIGASVTVTGHTGISMATEQIDPLGETGPAIVSGFKWPNGSKIYVENLGKVYGGGGRGSTSVMEAIDSLNVGVLNGANRWSSYYPVNGATAVSNWMDNDVKMYVVNKGTMMSGGGGGGRGEDIAVGAGHPFLYSSGVDAGTNIIPGNEGSGAGVGGWCGRTTWYRDVKPLVWLWVSDGIEQRYDKYSIAGSPSEGVRGANNVRAVSELIRRSDMARVWVSPGRGGKGGDAGMPGEAGTVLSVSTNNTNPPIDMTPSTLTSCQGARAGQMVGGSCIFTNQGGIVRSNDYK